MMNIPLENHHQDGPLPLCTSNELLSSSLGSGVFGLPSDALAQILNGPRPTQDHGYDGNSNFATPDLTSNISYPISGIFQNSQIYKNFPDNNTIPYFPTPRMDEVDNRPNMMPSEYTRFFRWAPTEDNTHKAAQPKPTRPSGDQVIPALSLSPTGANRVTAVPYVVPSLNAQGLVVDDDSKDEDDHSSDASPRGEKKSNESQGDDKAQKKKRRQEKNREAAQLFRQRQKAKVHELERSVNELTCNNSEFRMKMEILAFENKILKDQLYYLKNLVSSGIVITGSPSTAFPSLPVAPNLEKAEAALTAAMVSNNSMSAPHTPLHPNAAASSIGVHPASNPSNAPKPVPSLTPKNFLPASIQTANVADESLINHL